MAAPSGGEVAVPGGRDILDLIGADGFDEVPLARAARVRLGAGRGLFAACEAGRAAGDVLAAGGLVADAPRWLDEPAGVSLTVWRPPPG